MSDRNDTLTKYIGDMIAVEQHIQQAIERQVESTKDWPEVNQKVRTFAQTLDQHVNALKSHLEKMGGSPTHPVKEAGSAVLGVAAGLIDKVRDEKASKMFRDDYTALNLSTVSYVMLHTTALALKDQATADLALRHLEDNARFVMDINKFIPYLVVNDLKDDAPVDRSVVEQAVRNTQKAWQTEKSNQPVGQTATSANYQTTR